jgi:glycerol-3-phosphate dehydrogenase (NAD(P)+)
MGTALAQVIAGNGHSVRLWSIETDVLEEIRDHHLNSKYLEGVDISPDIVACWDLPEALAGASLAIISVPSQVIRAVAKTAAPHLQPTHIVLNVAKGLESETHLRMSQVLAEELPQSRDVIASMGGPAIAAELARLTPMAVIVGAEKREVAAHVQKILHNGHLKVDTTTDLTGVELAATLKNVYAISLGICDGLRHGMNTKAFLASIALAEMAALSEDLGGRAETPYGLAGLGDLLTTGYSPHSRNRTLGEKLCGGPGWREYLETHTVEGALACRSIKELTERSATATPLLDTLHSILFTGRPAVEAIREFLRDFYFRD